MDFRMPYKSLYGFALLAFAPLLPLVIPGGFELMIGLMTGGPILLAASAIIWRQTTASISKFVLLLTLTIIGCAGVQMFISSQLFPLSIDSDAFLLSLTIYSAYYVISLVSVGLVHKLNNISLFQARKINHD